MLHELKSIADEINRVAVGATVDRWGVPKLARVVILDVLEDSEEILFYDANDSAMSENLQYNPKASLSITNVKTFNGRQVKGIGEVTTSVTPITTLGRKLYSEAIQQGIKHFVRLRAAEIFDVLQKDKSLRDSFWQGTAFAEYDKLKISYPTFSPAGLQPVKFEGFKEKFNPFLHSQLEKRVPGFIGTVEMRGAPNISPRFVIGAEENFLLWGDRFKNKTFFNFSRPSPVAALTTDLESEETLEFYGWGKFFFFGKTVSLVNDVWRKIGFKDPVQAIHFFPEEIYRTAQKTRRSISNGRDRKDWLPMPAVKKSFNLNIDLSNFPSEQPKFEPVVATPNHLPKAVMLSNESLAIEITSALKNDIGVKLLPIENYDRSYLTESAAVMVTLGNRASEVDLYYIRALFDAAAFYGDARLEREKVKFIVFIAAFEKSLTLRALLNAFESYIKTLNQGNRTKVELVFVSLPMNAENDAVKEEIRKKTLESLRTEEFGELNYFKVADAD